METRAFQTSVSKGMWLEDQQHKHHKVFTSTLSKVDALSPCPEFAESESYLAQCKKCSNILQILEALGATARTYPGKQYLFENTKLLSLPEASSSHRDRARREWVLAIPSDPLGLQRNSKTAYPALRNILFLLSDA